MAPRKSTIAQLAAANNEAGPSGAGAGARAEEADQNAGAAAEAEAPDDVIDQMIVLLLLQLGQRDPHLMRNSPDQSRESEVRDVFPNSQDSKWSQYHSNNLNLNNQCYNHQYNNKPSTPDGRMLLLPPINAQMEHAMMDVRRILY